MKVMRLSIEQHRAQINIEIQRAQLHVERPDRYMEIIHERPEMTVSLENAEVELDMDELKANIGLKTYGQLTAQAAADARAHANREIKEIVRTSKYIGDVTIHDNKVAKVAKDKMLEYHDPHMGRSPVPPGAVEMDGKPGTIEINWSSYELSIDWVGEYMPEVYVKPTGSVNVEISTQPSVKISVSEVYIPALSGRNVNTEV